MKNNPILESKIVNIEVANGTTYGEVLKKWEEKTRENPNRKNTGLPREHYQMKSITYQMQSIIHLFEISLPSVKMKNSKM